MANFLILGKYKAVLKFNFGIKSYNYCQLTGFGKQNILNSANCKKTSIYIHLEFSQFQVTEKQWQNIIFKSTNIFFFRYFLALKNVKLWGYVSRNALIKHTCS